MASNPLRILCNSQNLIRTALLAASSVKPYASAVIPDRTTSRAGTGRVSLTGSYAGTEGATLDIEILDTTADVMRPSTPVRQGTGTGTLDSIAASAPFVAQDVTVTLKDAGIPIVSAALNFEGVKLVSTKVGADGNNTHLHVDASGLAFTATTYSLIAGLSAGAGGPSSPLAGPANDFGHAAVGEDGVIPVGAPRLAFGDDTTVYTGYKRFADGAWGYYYVPALLRNYPAGTIVKTVTATRTVTIIDSNDSPPTEEPYTGIVTVYDLLSAIRGGSELVTVQGVVANDRTPTGQAAREFLTRTDARCEPSSGTGSRYAAGFASTFAAADAGTKAIIARCYAVTGKDHPQAHLGATRWALTDTLLGQLPDAIEGVAYVGPDFGLLIERKLPPGYGTPKGRYSLVGDINYATRTGEESAPPICVDLAQLGSAAIDQQITVTFHNRPSGDCLCDSLPTPRWSSRCLGTVTEEGSAVGYQTDTKDRLKLLRTWFRERVRDNSAIGTSGDVDDGIGSQDAFIAQPLGVLQPVSVVSSVPHVEYAPSLSLKEIVDRFETVLAQIDPLEPGSPSLRSDGCAAWDVAFDELKTDVTEIETTPGYSFPSDRYTARLDEVLITAGISPLGESDASILESGDGCWRDWTAPTGPWWTVEGSEGGGYAPAFTNHAYYSSRRATKKDRYFSTHEFGFIIKVKDGCEADIKDGDSFVLTIGDAAWPSTYQVGDELTLPIVAARDAYLAGGQYGNTLQVWNVYGSVAGAMPPYTLDTSAPVAYSSGGLTFLITDGAIKFALADAFKFSIEGGHYKWRVDGGAWNIDSPPADIPDGPVLLYEGLSATFAPGAAPSFAAGDLFSFTLDQPRAASNIQAPGPESWQWDGDDQSIVCDLGSAQAFRMLAIPLHTIPAGATITVEAGTAPGVYTLDTTLDRVEGPIVKELDTPWTARYMRLTISDAPDATVGWFYAGNAMSTDLTANTVLADAWRVERADVGLYGGGRYLAQAVNATIEWTEAALPEADVAKLKAMMLYAKQHDDEPIVVVPNITRPADALIGRIAVDEVEFPDIKSYQANANVPRRHETRFPVSGVWR